MEINSYILKISGNAELPKERNCDVCSTKYTYKTSKSMYCSSMCRSKKKSKGSIEITCKQCHKLFKTFPCHINCNFCSISCSKRNLFKDKTKHPRYRKEIKLCTGCKVIEIKNNKIYCSRQCSGKYRVISDFHRQKIKEAHSGDKNNNWKGGVTTENNKIRKSVDYNKWRKEVYARDNYTCRLCGKRCQSKDIVAHHIMLFSQFPEERFNVKNGITLDRSCHLKLHSQVRSFLKEVKNLQEILYV